MTQLASVAPKAPPPPSANEEWNRLNNDPLLMVNGMLVKSADV